ncbi:putative fatty acyl-CoA reductase 4 [Armadillidium nasatum]|uniref:Fatty acyl-CoA reductase n=1 Tax=Armadillidium nasatum TaxID=96803 RepID=A0A5N5SJJ9_9CRUS|nr:putative fatty acyl-CoA reductase 4 [Armadillidium nasatum]
MKVKTYQLLFVRPSVVVGAFEEPMPGWTESLYHINGILVAAGRGVLRVLNCDPDTVLDIIPVDFVSNLLVACPTEKSSDSLGEYL